MTTTNTINGYEMMESVLKFTKDDEYSVYHILLLNNNKNVINVNTRMYERGNLWAKELTGIKNKKFEIGRIYKLIAIHAWENGDVTKTFHFIEAKRS